MPSFEVDFEVYCNACGAGLCHAAETGVTRSRRALCVRIEPCEDCMRNNHEAGLEAGLALADKRGE